MMTVWEKVQTLVKTIMAPFGATFGKNLGYFLFQHLVTMQANNFPGNAEKQKMSNCQLAFVCCFNRKRRFQISS